ncbi:MFS transporter [Streptomyces boninensis]|uniref:MFS transporter n=1 Tax=Streptomyces boninensis TaxID=2039455 RepID=UPI003B20F058
MSATPVPIPERATPKQWLGLSVLLLPTVVLFLAMTVLFLATPQMAADLQPSSAQLLWINDIYGFMVAGLLVAMGTLGDRWGRRRILLLGAAAFGIASAIAAFSPNAELLIATRAVMGLGAAAVLPSTLSLITNMFRDERQRGMAIGLWAASVSVGVAIGPLVGGLLLESFWWGAALLFAVPVMALVLVAAPVLLPEYRAPESGKLDPLSVVLSIVMLLPLVYGIKDLAKDGVGAVPLTAIAAGVVLIAGFVVRQLRLESPLLDVRLFANRTFSGALIVFLLGAIALGGVYLLFTQYLQLVAGLSPLEAGLWILPAAVALIAVSMLSPLLARRVRPAYIIAVGMAVSAVGYLVLAQVGSVHGLPLLITGFYILYPGIAPAMALTTDIVVNSAPPEKAGAASATNETASELGVALGIAVLGSIGTGVYRSEMLGSVPQDIPAGAAEASRDTLTGALSAAEQLPGALAADLLEPAKAAFASGLNTASWIAAGLVLIAGLVSATLLRKVPTTGSAAAEKEAPVAEADVEAPVAVPVGH